MRAWHQAAQDQWKQQAARETWLRFIAKANAVLFGMPPSLASGDRQPAGHNSSGGDRPSGMDMDIDGDYTGSRDTAISGSDDIVGMVCANRTTLTAN